MVFRAERVEINDVLRTAPAHMVSFLLGILKSIPKMDPDNFGGNPVVM